MIKEQESDLLSKTRSKVNSAIKITLSVLFFVCLAKMPYGYYQLVRFLALIGFGALAIFENKRNRKWETLAYVSLAILFQPLLKIPLGRHLWNTIDVVVAIALLLTLIRRDKIIAKEGAK